MGEPAGEPDEGVEAPNELPVAPVEAEGVELEPGPIAVGPEPGVLPGEALGVAAEGPDAGVEGLGDAAPGVEAPPLTGAEAPGVGLGVEGLGVEAGALYS